MKSRLLEKLKRAPLPDLHRPDAMLRPPRSGLKPPATPMQHADSDEDSERSSNGVDNSRVRPLQPTSARKDGSVRVAVRIRPMLPRELARNAATCVTRPTGEVDCVCVGGAGADNRKFTFDHVFPQSIKQTELYDEALQPWMSSFLQGFNVTVIAYGQTGSGKTFTMGNAMPSTTMMANQIFSQSSTDSSSSEKDVGDVVEEDLGLIPRFLHQLFDKLAEKGGETQISVSFLEIYGEDIHDLLENPDAQRSRRNEPLQLRENKKNGVWVQGLTEVRVSTRQEAMEQMRRGSMHRVTASTQMNEHSSRSHAVYTVKIVQRVSQQEAKENKVRLNNQSASGRRSIKEPAPIGDMSQETDAVIVSKLTFVDLAGSERLKKTLAEGDRMKEGIQINVGLFALGNVINALGDEKRRAASHVHVPYRSSKLTRLLQDALGGNSRTLFIACVSPAESNSNETLNTLQYANRAKNIQNKAVKNIDSRTAELVSLKAFNQLLCRELIKAIFTRLGEVGPAEVDNLTDSTLTNPRVLAYLNKIEQVAVGAGPESSSDERSFETRRLLNGLTAQLYEMAPSNEFRRAASLSSTTEDENSCIEPQDDFLDLISDSESSVAIMEDPIPDHYAPTKVLYSLNKLGRTLDIVLLAYEMHETQELEARKRASFNSRILALETRRHRKELLRNGLADMIARMKTWLPSDPDSVKSREVQRNVDQAMEKLELIGIEIDDLDNQQAALADQLKLEIKLCRNAWKEKHNEVEQLRQTRDHDETTTALGVLSRADEIKVRFGAYDLERISNYLNEEEKEVTTYINEHDEDISHMSPLFTREELSLPHSKKILAMIQNQLQIALDKEDLQTSLAKELRNRSQLFRNITSGLMACHRGDMTEQEFMEKNEQDLKACEEKIAQISDAVRAKSSQRASMIPILDSITSLEAAKCVIRALIAEIYSTKRIFMVFIDSNMLEGEEQDEKDAKLIAMGSEMNENVKQLEVKYEKDVQCAFQMVTQFNDTVGADSMHLTEDSAAFKAQTSALSTLAGFEEREEQLVTQLADKDAEMERMRIELDKLQASAKNAEMKEESFRLMTKCQDIWKELGLDEEYQASKFHDINELLVKKCSEELEGLEAAREKLQLRIDDAYRVVSQLELVLNVSDRLDIEAVSSLAGDTLLEQEKYLLTVRKRLEVDLCSRANARVRTSDGIHRLAAALQIKSTADFRHIPQNKVGDIDQSLKRASTAHLSVWRDYQKNSESSTALEVLLGSLDDTSSAFISGEFLQQDEAFLTVLLKEKTRRITELDESLDAIRMLARKMQLSHGDINAVVNALQRSESPIDNDEADYNVNRFDELKAWILQKGGQLDVSNKWLELLATTLQCFKEIEAGRSNALEFLRRTLEEATMLTQDVHDGEDIESDSLRKEHIGVSIAPLAHTMNEHSCFRDTLVAGKEKIERLNLPMEMALTSIFCSMNDDFAAFGIDTNDQRISFFVGREDEGLKARRAILEKYAVFASRLSSDEEQEDAKPPPALLPDCHDSFLSKLDPAFEEFHRTYSLSHGELQLQRLRDSITDISAVKRIVKSAHNRLQSLKKIMKLFNQINDFKTKIAEFEANASKKDRLFGNSLRLLEEERFRKMAAKRYPNLLSALRKEVTRWLENEDGEYDLSMLGEDLKNLLLDMMNTNTGLMHLDLGVVDHQRSAVRRSSKLTPNSSSTNLQAADGPARARSQSGTPRARSSLHASRSLNFDQE